MPTHTLGPWTENACEIQAEDGSPICEMLVRPEDSGVNYPYSPVADANSRLICAAPDLLNALGEMLDHFEDNEQYSEDDSTVINFARRIYNQASGGE
tara:strand:- start:87 stop:377 length:291 start_codon:yes stop_codon:yes gene_type:complete